MNDKEKAAEFCLLLGGPQNQGVRRFIKRQAQEIELLRVELAGKDRMIELLRSQLLKRSQRTNNG